MYSHSIWRNISLYVNNVFLILILRSINFMYCFRDVLVQWSCESIYVASIVEFQFNVNLCIDFLFCFREICFPYASMISTICSYAFNLFQRNMLNQFNLFLRINFLYYFREIGFLIESGRWQITVTWRVGWRLLSRSWNWSFFISTTWSLWFYVRKHWSTNWKTCCWCFRE